MAHQNIIPIPVRGDFPQEAFERIFDAMTKDNPLIYYLNQLTKILLKSYISKQKKRVIGCYISGWQEVKMLRRLPMKWLILQIKYYLNQKKEWMFQK